MNTLQYYEQYRALNARLALLEGQMHFLTADTEEFTPILRQIEAEKREIEESLSHYIPYPLSARQYHRALEEQEFLFYRCIKGLTMKKTAELMCISRDTAYRIRRRIARGAGRHASFDD